ncbi:MAG: epoxyqueuosine reductase QueH [Treponemataceae bacterium]
MKKNYHSVFKEILTREAAESPKKKLLFHTCCAPCSTTVLQQLMSVFDISIFYYNPNIWPESEYNRRFEELQHFLLSAGYTFNLFAFPYDHNSFLEKIKNHEMEQEGGERCFLCYELRLIKTAEYAKQNDFDYFTTSLSISPHKNAQKINEIGDSLQKKLDVKYLYADFKKENGFKLSVEISKKFNLYRQNYCGCEFS